MHGGDALSYARWDSNEGARPTSSTDANPMNFCYVLFDQMNGEGGLHNLCAHDCTCRRIIHACARQRTSHLTDFPLVRSQYSLLAQGLVAAEGHNCV